MRMKISKAAATLRFWRPKVETNVNNNNNHNNGNNNSNNDDNDDNNDNDIEEEHIYISNFELELENIEF